MIFKQINGKTASSIQGDFPAQATGEISKSSSKLCRLILFLLVIGGCLEKVSAQATTDLFFREDWKEIEAALPVTQEHVSNPNLELSLFGPGKEGIKKSNHPPIPNDPYYIWSGECRGNWAVSLRHRILQVDLTGPAEIHWRTRQSGFRQLRLILKLADGKWVVSDEYAGESADWETKVIKIADVRWRELNIDTVTEGNWINDPDLSQVMEIGFTDLMVGGQSKACSRLDWIAVYGKPVDEEANLKQ